MRVLHSWLQQYIKFTLRPEVLAEKLGMLGLEIEGIEHLGEKYSGLVVGQVVEKAKHPNADKLSVCKVNVGKESLQIVCGGPNVASGQKVAVGKVGAVVPRNQHDPNGKPFVLSQIKIRGVESFGMICSEYELDLGEDSDGILVLDPSAKVGQPLAQYLGLDDIAYDIEVTPNRPDWLSHVGVAREIGVILKRQPKIQEIKLKEASVSIRKHLTVKVDDKVNCRRFAARIIRGVTIQPSPKWLQDTLTKVGLRPRNNVVDITNYVMLECGQPLHAFDYDLLRGKTIIVRSTKGPSSFKTLDGKAHQLPAGAVMVCDAEREVSIAGIMGGENSEIHEATRDVVLESANWNPSNIRRTSKKLGISTDASQRFERGADPEAVVYALNRASQLILDLAGGSLLKGMIDIYPKKIAKRIVPLRIDRANALLGTSLSAKDIMHGLNLLNIKSKGKKGDRILLEIPSYRIDIEREVDLIEEIARVYGYDRIEVKTTVSLNLVNPFPVSTLASRVREHLIGLGFQEAVTVPMLDEKKGSLGEGSPVRLVNPQSSDMGMLRKSLIPGLLDVVARNQSFGSVDLRLFEIGHVFQQKTQNGGPPRLEEITEEEHASLVITGQFSPGGWNTSDRLVDVYDMKGEVANLFAKFALDKPLFISYPTSNCLAEDAVTVEINGSRCGHLGAVRADLLNLFGIEQQVFVAELNLKPFSSGKERKYQPLPRFPKVRRDVAFIVDGEVMANDIERTLKEASSGLVSGVELFDVYEGENLPDGKKGLAFGLEMMSREKTLREDEIDAEVETMVKRVEQKFGATLRRT